MNRYWFVGRLAVALAMMTVSILALAYAVGVIPDPEVQAMRSRADLATALGIQAAASVQNRDESQYDTLLHTIMESNQELLSAGLRDITGELVVNVGGHADHWVDPGEK